MELAQNRQGARHQCDRCLSRRPWQALLTGWSLRLRTLATWDRGPWTAGAVSAGFGKECGRGFRRGTGNAGCRLGRGAGLQAVLQEQMLEAGRSAACAATASRPTGDRGSPVRFSGGRHRGQHRSASPTCRPAGSRWSRAWSTIRVQGRGFRPKASLPPIACLSATGPDPVAGVPGPQADGIGQAVPRIP